jgi:molybdopterin molybdotransferase
MRRSSSSALLPLAVALEQLRSITPPVAPRWYSVPAALGAVSARDVLVPADLPAAPMAVRDGWAIAFADAAGASPNAPVPLAEPPPWVEAGEAMPDGADAVLAPDAIEPGGREASAEVAPGDGVALAGSELRGGEVIVGAGAVVSSRHLLAPAAAGIDGVEVRRPRVALLPAGAGRGRLDLLPTIAALVSEAGGEVVPFEMPVHDPSALAPAITRAAGEADAVLVLGGTGFGRTDHAATALAEAGTLLAHGIAIRPGETAGFGSVEDRPVLMLPGRPDAALAAFVLLARPMLGGLSGRPVHGAGEALPLTRKVSSPLGLGEVIFAHRDPSGIVPLGGSGIPLRRLLQADRFILVPPGQEGYPAGVSVETMPLWSSR